MKYFKFELQLKFRKNCNYCPLIVNFHTGLRYKYVNLQLKLKKKEN